MINTLLNRPYSTPDFLNKSHFPSLDGWRAGAVMLVILGHARATTDEHSTFYKLTNIFIYENLGVKIFFFLSGFLITSLLIKEFQKTGGINIKFFFIKRALRIFPVLYLYLAVVLLINYFLNLGISATCFLSAAFYVSNFNTFESSWLTGHTWTLAVEEQYYLIWPFIFSYFQSKTAIFCITLIISVTFLRIFWYYHPQYFQITLGPFLNFAETIFSGALLSILSFKKCILSTHKIWFVRGLSYFAIIIILILFYLSRQGYAGLLTLPFLSIIVNILIGFLMLKTMINHQDCFFRLLNHKLIVKIGLLSYSLYVWQELFLVDSHFYGAKISWSIFPINILFAIMAAYISYYYFERPFLNLKNKLLVKSHQL